METTGAAEARQLPQSATIIIRNQKPDDPCEVEVTPKAGLVHFENLDDREYRLRLYKPDERPLAGIDILLPAGGRATVVIKRDDVFLYTIVDLTDELSVGNGGGPIRN
jgi:hypothetical protein